MRDKIPQLSPEVWDDESFEMEPLEFDMICPRINLRRPDIKINNWSSAQCENRLRYKSDCTKKCPIAHEIGRNRLNKDEE